MLRNFSEANMDFLYFGRNILTKMIRLKELVKRTQHVYVQYTLRYVSKLCPHSSLNFCNSESL